MQIVDKIIIISYVVFCLYIGIKNFNKTSTFREYAIGNKEFTTFTIISTIFATFVSVEASIGDVEEVYKMGIIYCIPLLLSSVLWILMSRLFVKNIDKFSKHITLSSIMFELYGNVGGWTTNVCVLVASISALAIEVTAIGYLFEYFFGIDYKVGAIIGFSIITIYCTLGGIKAVAITDVFQFIIFFIGFPLACGYIYNDAGGINEIIEKVPHRHKSTDFLFNNTSLFLGYSFWSILPVISAPFIQRLLMAKNRVQLLNAYKILPVLTFIFSIVIIIMSYSILAKNNNIEPKFALYYSMSEYLPSVIKGIMVTGMMAIIMSTSDSIINASSSIIAHDIIKKIYKNITDKQQIYIARISCIVISLISVLVALQNQGIMELIWAMDNFWWPIMFVPLLLGFLGVKRSNKAFLISSIFGISGSLITRQYIGEFGVVSVMIGTLFSSIILALGKVKGH